MFKWIHFQKQDRRSYTLIAPCKRSAARGKKMLYLLEPRSSSTPFGVVGGLSRFSTPHYMRGYPHYTPSGVCYHNF